MTKPIGNHFRTEYKWMCQQCGLSWVKRTKGEPRICPICKYKGCKTFEGCVKVKIRKCGERI